LSFANADLKLYQHGFHIFEDCICALSDGVIGIVTRMVHPDGPPDRHPMGLGAAEAEFQALALVTATAAVLATPEVEIQFLHLKNKEVLKNKAKKKI
jgi:hypothetical protein